MTTETLELLAPARDADIGIEAVNHGADAVYIGGPAFGARDKASNDMADLERLAAHAHRFHARVYMTLNTILRDDELEPARRIARQAWDAGVDALIVQDMGLLQIDLPPIQLHASTQTDVRTPEKARFLQDVGFSKIILARELDLRPGVLEKYLYANAESFFFGGEHRLIDQFLQSAVTVLVFLAQQTEFGVARHQLVLQRIIHWHGRPPPGIGGQDTPRFSRASRDIRAPRAPKSRTGEASRGG